MGAKSSVIYLDSKMDTTALARQLGLSVSAVKNRAQNLGLIPEEISAGRGRPKQIWSQEQIFQITNYGSQPQEPQGWTEDFEQTGQLAVTTAQNEIGLMLQKQLAAVDLQAEQLEDRLAQTIAARLAIVPSRSFQKATALIQSDSFGVDVMGFGQIPLTPRLKAISGDRFPETV
jgi:predicted ArsR family transcriptional regulator